MSKTSKPWYLLKDDFEIFDQMEANDNNDIWYQMTKMKLAKLGVDVGEDMSSEIKLAEEHGHAKRLVFETNDKYKVYILDYVTEADKRGELTDAVMVASREAWGNIPEEDMEGAVYKLSLKNYSEDANEAQAWGVAVEEHRRDKACEAMNEEGSPWDECDDYEFKYRNKS